MDRLVVDLSAVDHSVDIGGQVGGRQVSSRQIVSGEVSSWQIERNRKTGRR